MKNYYWVNQGKTFKEEKEGGYLWAPVENKKGNTVFHWKNITKLKIGDIVFNYVKGEILGYSEIISDCFKAPQPEEFNVDVEWEEHGYMIDAKYNLFESPLVLNTILKSIEHYLPEKYSPVNVDIKTNKAKANQGYLYEINNNVAKKIFELSNTKWFEKKGQVNENEIKYSTHPKNTSREGTVISRVGQGEYRQKLLRRWKYKCAVSKVSIKEILIASHILAWKDSDDRERLDIENGLLLSPVYDSLFDKHLISFDDNGKIILSDSLRKEDLSKIGVTGNERIQNLSNGNKYYLSKHRKRLVKL